MYTNRATKAGPVLAQAEKGHMLRNLYTVIDQKVMSFGSHSGDMHSPTELFSIKGDKIFRRG